MTHSPPPFPDRLRQRLRPPKPRLRVILLALLPALVLLLPSWRLRAVEIVPFAGLPPSTQASSRTMIGTPVILLDLSFFKRQADSWPAVRSADVVFELPGTLKVSTRPAAAAASVVVAEGWHGVTNDGRLCGQLTEPKNPVLHGFSHQPTALKTALHIVRRIESSAGTVALSARSLLPGSLEIELQSPDAHQSAILVRAARQPTAAEGWWSRRMLRGEGAWSEVDLRFEDRAIVGGAL